MGRVGRWEGVCKLLLIARGGLGRAAAGATVASWRTRGGGGRGGSPPPVHAGVEWHTVAGESGANRAGATEPIAHLARECVMNPAHAEASKAQGDGDDAQRHHGRERHDERAALASALARGWFVYRPLGASRRLAYLQLDATLSSAELPSLSRGVDAHATTAQATHATTAAVAPLRTERSTERARSGTPCSPWT